MRATQSVDRFQWPRASRGVLLALVCAGAFWVVASLSRAAEEETAPTHSTRAGRTTTPQMADTNRSTRTSDTGRAARVEAKLDQVLANQERILARLDEVMEELKIVKIRATVR